eukprot:11153750-Lingulodinium_polyedra.AAC.1
MPLLSTPTLFTMPGLPNVSSVVDCAALYWSSLTAQQRCGIGRRLAGPTWLVATACSGTDSLIKVLEQIGRASGWNLTHAFSCVMNPDKQ